MSDINRDAKSKVIKNFIGEKIFTDADQFMFATISGDFNPMHMDSMVARKLITGKKVVHGVHLLLSALEFWLDRNANIDCEGLKCEFKNPVSVGDCAIFHSESINPHKSVIRIYVNDLLCLKISLSLASNIKRSLTNVTANPVSGEAIVIDSLDKPLDIEPVDQVGKKYRHTLNYSFEGDHFPLIKLRFGDVSLASLCSLSYFAGMVCPGLHSLFSSVNIKFLSLAESQPTLLYSVEQFDDRFGLLYISVQGVIEGNITVFRRPSPAVQPTMISLRSEIKSDEFLKTTSLIIGGSRGIGECAAKILASGGAHTIITYASGAEDAARVCDEINAYQPGSSRAVKFDVLHDFIDAVDIGTNQIDDVYYFATPRIFRKKVALYEPEVFADFFAIYVEKFYFLCRHFEEKSQKPVKIFLPSSVAVAERPSDLAEYAMAKAAAEILAEEINKSFKWVTVVVSRLPRLETDQTATVTRVPAQSALDVMLPLIRSMHSC